MNGIDLNVVGIVRAFDEIESKPSVVPTYSDFECLIATHRVTKRETDILRTAISLPDFVVPLQILLRFSHRDSLKGTVPLPPMSPRSFHCLLTGSYLPLVCDSISDVKLSRPSDQILSTPP